mmetsp:Transcript_3623/g.11349  ORF Transcript_3623/g.11349 Transcript_3623/m.11349 type:complete len:261 (-) Transcript_3623:780-1562(-)
MVVCRLYAVFLTSVTRCVAAQKLVSVSTCCEMRPDLVLSSWLIRTSCELSVAMSCSICPRAFSACVCSSSARAVSADCRRSSTEICEMIVLMLARRSRFCCRTSSRRCRMRYMKSLILFVMSISSSRRRYMRCFAAVSFCSTWSSTSWYSFCIRVSSSIDCAISPSRAARSVLSRSFLCAISVVSCFRWYSSSIASARSFSSCIVLVAHDPLPGICAAAISLRSISLVSSSRCTSTSCWQMPSTSAESFACSASMTALLT